MTAKRILVVEDDGDVRRAICDFLGAAGCTCLPAADTTGALDLLRHDQVDAVLTDISLSEDGEHDGLEIVSFIRERRLPIRVIVMTAYASSESARRARDAADVFVEKPVSLHRLAYELGIPGGDDGAATLA